MESIAPIELSVRTKLTLDELSNAIVKSLQGKEVMRYIVGRMIMKISLQIRKEEKERFPDKAVLAKLQTEKTLCQAVEAAIKNLPY